VKNDNTTTGMPVLLDLVVVAWNDPVGVMLS
jgi:hypothetical protein